MCGIFFSLSRSRYIKPDANTEELLRHRGPDSSGSFGILVPPPSSNNESRSIQAYATFFSTVLSLRGTSVINQPLEHEATGSILCWNGEAWSIQDLPVRGNDSQTIFDFLLKSPHLGAADSRTSSMRHVVNVLSSVRGPYAFVYYDARNRYLYFGRDCLGRRSLLRKVSAEDEIVLSSVCDNTTGAEWAEVEADGLYVVDLDIEALARPSLIVLHIPLRRAGEVVSDNLAFNLPFPKINSDFQDPLPSPIGETISQLKESLKTSLAVRIQHVREAVIPPTVTDCKQEAKVAILFSGGLDCTILARLSHDLLPLNASIDLLNVAFENPRIHGKLDAATSPYELCPDRITGRSSYAELLKVCPGRRWRFLEVNVPYTETVAHRINVMALMHPHNTEMDLSISYALYFASRGVGQISDGPNTPSESYTTTAFVLLSGLGADELFGGYQRHALAFSRKGYSGLVDELKLDFDRLGKRNLGRDDRVISDSGKEVRFPYLDEDFIKLALELPVSAKCDFGKPQVEGSEDPEQFLEPGKRILRLLAWESGMESVAAEKKRAIQFGARTAKMETGRTKGTQVLS